MIFVGLFTLAFIISLAAPGTSKVSIQIHDTHLVLHKASLAILILGALTFFVFLVRAAVKKFGSVGANVGLIIGLVLLCFITYRIIDLQKIYLNEISAPEDEWMLDKDQFISDMKTRISWTWRIFGLWIICVLILTLWTIRLWWGQRYTARVS